MSGGIIHTTVGIVVGAIGWACLNGNGKRDRDDDGDEEHSNKKIILGDNPKAHDASNAPNHADTISGIPAESTTAQTVSDSSLPRSCYVIQT